MSNLTEEQQLEQLKDWWNDNGTPLIIGAVLGLSGFFGYKYWTEKQIAYQESASNLYVQVTEQLEEKDNSKLAEAAQQVKSEYPDSTYAILSAFHLAKIAVEEKDLNKATEQFNWVLSNHAGNELANIAKIRLARILITQEQAQKALELLNFDKESGYFEVASMVKGDALLALGKKPEALEAYQAADNLGKVTASHPTLKLLIEELAAVDSSISKTTPTETTANDSAAQETDSNTESQSEDKPETEGASE